MTQFDSSSDQKPLQPSLRSLPMALLQARESVMVRFRGVLRVHGLTEQQWRVMRLLSESPHKLRPLALSHITFISMPSLSRLLKTLEGRGMIERARHATDLRGAEFSLTPEGLALVKAIAPAMQYISRDIEEAVGHENLERLYQMLSDVMQRLGLPAEGGLDDE